jgi:hypothetical protein
MGIFHQRDERQFLLEVIMTDRFSNFADLAEHYAREIATPDYARIHGADRACQALDRA